MAKILLLTPQIPYPPEQGASLRNYHIIRGLSLNHGVDLLTFQEAGQKSDSTLLGPLFELCDKIAVVPVPLRSKNQRIFRIAASNKPDMAHRLQSPVFDNTLTEMLIGKVGEGSSIKPYDIVQIEGLELARAIPIIRQLSPSSKIVFDNHNAETELQRRAMHTDLNDPRRWPLAGYSWVQVRRLARFEKWACESADSVTVVSESDRRHILSLNQDLTPFLIPNCLDVKDYLFSEDLKPIHSDLLFSGKMDYRPNVDAVLWFASEIWPRIKRGFPAATWTIAGQKPHSRLNWLQSVDGITLTGWVESMKPYFAGAKVYVMPLRMGSGTRLKVLEAMASGIAIVSTSVGSEGYPVETGKQLLNAEEPQAFADAVVHLLQNLGERERLAKNGILFAKEYDWRRIIPKFDQVYSGLR